MNGSNATFKGHKRNFVVVLGEEKLAKNVPNGTKSIQGNKNVLREQKMLIGKKYAKGRKTSFLAVKNLNPFRLVLLYNCVIIMNTICQRNLPKFVVP